jgi:hypothetical protein
MGNGDESAGSGALRGTTEPAVLDTHIQCMWAIDQQAT